MKKKQKIDLIIEVIAITMLIGSVVIASQYYYNSKSLECSSNPLVYSAKFMEETYGYPFQGTGYFIMRGGSPIVYFNSYNFSIKNP